TILQGFTFFISRFSKTHAAVKPTRGNLKIFNVDLPVDLNLNFRGHFFDLAINHKDIAFLSMKWAFGSHHFSRFDQNLHKSVYLKNFNSATSAKRNTPAKITNHFQSRSTSFLFISSLKNEATSRLLWAFFTEDKSVKCKS